MVYDTRKYTQNQNMFSANFSYLSSIFTMKIKLELENTVKINFFTIFTAIAILVVSMGLCLKIVI